ncbi:unnamed protein product [Boreogadus saida]
MGLRARVRRGQHWASVSKVSRKPSLSTGPVSSQGQNGASIYAGPGGQGYARARVTQPPGPACPGSSLLSSDWPGAGSAPSLGD